jgi:P4 family phage/plasmid primase-like protien
MFILYYNHPNKMKSISKTNTFKEFLAQHSTKCKNNENKEITHTRIGDTDLHIFGGKYHIDDLPAFYEQYYDHVFVRGQPEYLTEKQLQSNGPILVDFDFRYDYSITSRMHDSTHIADIISLYLDELKQFFVFEQGKPFPVFILEKPNVNRVTDKQITKDGIHMIIGIKMDRVLQIMLRERIIQVIGDTWELPLLNDWANVLDEGVTKGAANWQLYGSRKPGNEAYALTYHIEVEVDAEDGEFMTRNKNIKDFDLSQNLQLLSAQYDKHVEFALTPKMQEEYNKRLMQPITKTRKSSSKGKITLLDIVEEEDIKISINDITSSEILSKAVEQIMNSLDDNEHHIKELHHYTQILPEKYYEPGSHLLNRQVAFALKHTDERLFLSWVMLRSKASDFEYSSIPKLANEWSHFSKKSDGITRRSILYWAKQDAYEDYIKVKQTTVDYYIEKSIFDAGDFDYALVLYQMYKDKYVCSNITTKSWYVFTKNRWEKDEGQSLRMAISSEMFTKYQNKMNDLIAQVTQIDPAAAIEEKEHSQLQQKIKCLSNICSKLKKTNDKNNIMREAMEIFFVKDFLKQLNSNPYLLCFTNGVIDFRTKEFRQGYPQDYISKTTGIPYIPYNYDLHKMEIDQINTFMSQLFPQPNLTKYMWEHLASSLIGIKQEQVFNIYCGSGSNGKSILTDLMTQALGEYKGTVPVTLVTDKRGSIGGTSSEVMQLKGVRYAVMQELSKDAIINEGIMKELTGGDPIQARALYADSETFIPQFSLVVCTNALPEVKSNDDGTWRRMKKVDFISKFIVEGEHHTDDTPHIFPKDKTLKEKLPKWAPIFMSMLVKRAFETNGEVLDCPEVVSASKEYRNQQDCISSFIEEKLYRLDGSKITQSQVSTAFKEWFTIHFGSRKSAPKLLEIETAITKRFGPRTGKNSSSTKYWYNLAILQEEEEEMEDEEHGTILGH